MLAEWLSLLELMMRSFEEMMRRLRSYSAGVHPDTGEALSPHKTHKNHNSKISNPENHKTDKTYKDYRGLYLLIHSDPSFLLAQDWGMEPGLLYKLCKQYGTAWVKSCIVKVHGIGDRYFREGDPIPPQRGRYCRTMILRDGKPLDG
ncbi:MAG TPA: hypothetical protein V6C52_02910 [Coleofasciculaceae cyanobacterium]|jgi:hypothetical protein